MVIHLLRVLLAHTVRPFRFNPGKPPAYPLDMKNLGLYVHIPFCRSICDFCPYNKTLFDEEKIKSLVDALLREIDLLGAPLCEKKHVQSVYFGGGTPALAGESLSDILDKLREYFVFDHGIAIELHPDDVDERTLRILRDAGFDMVSIGVQSFNEHVLKGLGRKPVDSRAAVHQAVVAGFRTVDVDLIFCLPGQRAADLTKDFEIAASLGATQISTYPFIEFSYTSQRRKAQGRREKKEMLFKLVETADKLGFERSSVWSFTRAGTHQYSSVTRDSFVGFGPSASSLYKEYFTINTFSVDAYIDSLSEGSMPTALTLAFNRRTRALYWLFWSAYNMRIGKRSYRELFGHELTDMFSSALRMGVWMGVLKIEGEDIQLTEKGAYWFHLVEQKYTHQYIDKTWRTCGSKAWPGRIALY